VKRKELKIKDKQERNTARIERMLLTLGPKLKTVTNAECKKNEQLKYLRKQAKRTNTELLNDERVIGMMQCYHIFRTLCKYDVTIGVSNELEQITINKDTFNDLKEEVNRLYEKVLK